MTPEQYDQQLAHAEEAEAAACERLQSARRHVARLILHDYRQLRLDVPEAPLADVILIRPPEPPEIVA